MRNNFDAPVPMSSGRVADYLPVIGLGIHTGDRVQSYSYGQPYRTGTVLYVSMGRAEVKLDGNGGTAWIETDFLTKIN